MDISIEYCTAWNYKPRAAGLADELKQAFGVTAELIPSGGGVFEVRLDEKLIFSKKALSRFPDDGEMVKLIRGA